MARLMRTVSVECSPLNPATETRSILRFTDRDEAGATLLNGERCWPGIMSNATLNREGWNGDWSASVAVPQAEFDVSLSALRKADDQSPPYRWAGAPVRIYLADGGAPALLFDGIATDGEIDGGLLKITSRVDDEPFSGDALPLTFDGGGGLGGQAEMADIVRPACFGFCRNVEPLIINNVDYVFQLHGYGPIEGIAGVFERGIDFGVSAGDFADYAALMAASVPEGRWATSLAHGLLRLGAPPAGVITCDVKGDNTGGWHRTTAAIIARLCDICGVSPTKIDAASMAAFEVSVPYPVNVYISSQEPLLAAITRLVLPCNAQASFSWLGKLQVARFANIPAATLEFNLQGAALPPAIGNEEQPVSPPFWRLETQYARCWRPQTTDELAIAEDLGDPVSTIVWRRYPTQPPTPTGDRIPEGWQLTRPTYEIPTTDINAGGYTTLTNVYAAGPIWRSSATQLNGITTAEGWALPLIDDTEYSGFTIATDNGEGRILTTANSVATVPTLAWAPNSDDNPAMAFIPDGINGPFDLSFRVRKGSAMFAAGVMISDPRTLSVTALDLGDLFAGVLVLNNNKQILSYTNPVPPNYSYERLPLTGVFLFNEWDFTNNYVDDRIGASSFNLPGDDELYQITYNGENIDIYTNGVHVRTFRHWVKDWGTEGFWPTFALLDGNAEIYDIEWGPGTAGRRTSSVPVQYIQGGAVRYRQHLKQWEIYSPYAYYEAFGYAYAGTDLFKGDATLSFEMGVPGADVPPYANPGYTQFAALENNAGSTQSLGFRFKSNATFGLYNNPGFLPRAYLSGDHFSIEIKKRIARYFHNGVLLSRQLIKPGSYWYGYWELGANGWVRRFEVQRSGDDSLLAGNSVETTTSISVANASTPVVVVAGADYIVIATTPTLSYTVPTFTDLGGAGSSDYHGVTTTSASFVIRATGGYEYGLRFTFMMIQASTNGGSSWVTVSSGGGIGLFSNGPADRVKQTIAGRQTGLYGTQSVIFRLLGYRPGFMPDGWELAIEDFSMQAQFAA